MDRNAMNQESESTNKKTAIVIQQSQNQVLGIEYHIGFMVKRLMITKSLIL